MFKLSCSEWNVKHVKFNLFDPHGANCGKIVILTEDVLQFAKYSWNGNIAWNGRFPDDIVR